MKKFLRWYMNLNILETIGFTFVGLSITIIWMVASIIMVVLVGKLFGI